jgi:uncharacterized protein (TIGR02145 family)
MIKYITVIGVSLITFLPYNAISQAPNKFSYQAVIRNSSNALVTNSAVGMRISILQTSATGTAVYVGLASLEIGGGTVVSGNFSSINWANGPFFIKTETDPTGGINYSIIGTTQLLSVPYALFAENAGNSTPGPMGPAGVNGNGIASTIDNGDGTFTFNYDDGSVFTTSDLTGPQGATGQPGASGNGFSNGTTTNQIMFWNGSTWTPLNPGTNGQVLAICNNNLTWVTLNGICPVGTITSLACNSATYTGFLMSGSAANSVSVTVSYSGGNGAPHNGQSVASTNVTGLTASLSSGVFATGSGTLTYTITGVPSSSGIASFALNIGGQTCSLTFSVYPSYPTGTVYCIGIPTAVIDVTNPITGKIWMDRNLGALQPATSIYDTTSYGDLYQWGRRADGHQCRYSPITGILSSADQPAHGNFIIDTISWDWRNPQNTNLWQGVNGVNNPCPSGYRIPTQQELDAERLSWSTSNATGALASPLKLTMSGWRNSANGTLPLSSTGNPTHGYYWSSTVSGSTSILLRFHNSLSSMTWGYRGNGIAVRCIKN